MAKQPQYLWLFEEFKKRGQIFNYELATDYHLLQYTGRISEIRHKLGETIECLPDPKGRNGVNLYKYVPKDDGNHVAVSWLDDGEKI